MMGWREEKDQLPPLGAYVAPKHYYVSHLRKVEPRLRLEQWLNENAHGGWSLRFQRVIGFIQFNNPTDYMFFRLAFDDDT